MSKIKKKNRKNATLKERAASEVSAKKEYFRSDDYPTLSRQASRMMKEKYIRERKDHSKDKESDKGQTTGEAGTQATEQVQASGRWAAAELVGTTGRMVRQGREYAKKKAKAAQRDTPISPADDPPKQPTCTPPEVMPPKEFDPAPLTHQSPPPKVPSPMENSILGQAPPATAPKELKPKKRPIPANAPKERQPGGQEPIPHLEKEPRQSRKMAKPLKERPIDLKIKERPSMAAPKGSDIPSRTVLSSRPNEAKPGKYAPGKGYEKGPPPIKALQIHGETEKTLSSSQPRQKPKMAVPLDQRRALVEKQKASPYAARDGVPFAPPDTPSPANFTSPSPLSMPMSPSQPDPQQPPGAASMKNLSIDKTRKFFKERQRFSQKDIEHTGKPALSLKTRRANGTPAVRPGPQGPPAAAQRAAGAARRQAQRKMLAHPKKAVRSSVEALRRIAQTAAKAVSTVTSAVTALVGGGILLTALVIVIVIAAVANSPFGLFYAQEPNAPGTVSVAQAVGSVKEAYNAKLEELQTGDYDSIDIQGQAPDWTDVLAVFAVKLAGADVDGLDVATLDPDRVSKLTAVFLDMTAITTEVETIAHPASGNREAWTEKILHITITPKTADDMRTIYNFTPYQNSALDELLGDRPTLSSLAGSLDITGADEREVLAALPADLEQARRDTVEKALSLVGKVNYFWGGKSHAIGWDDRWGTLRKVTAAGSPSTGTYRPFGLDCSGMIDWALRNAGLPSDGNWYIGTNLTRVSASEARPGDMALFPDASHIGIVVGRNDAGKLLVCHCSSGRNNVVVTEFSATGFTVVGRPNMFD